MSFETTSVTMPKNGTLTYTVNADKTSLYRVLMEGTFYAKSIFNISVDSICYENVAIYDYAYDRVVFFVELEAGERKLGINMGMASAKIQNIDVSEVSQADADAFVAKINVAKTAEEVRDVVTEFDDKLKLCAMDVEEKIFYPVSAYDRMLRNDYENINELSDGLFSALFAEKTSPEVKLSENGAQITALKQGALELNIKNNESGNEIFAAIYDDENRLFSINRFVENPQEVLSCQIDLSSEDNAENFTFKLLSWNSAEKMIPKEKFSGVYKDIYMAKNGSDSGDGSESSPFATLSRVKEEILKYNSDMQGDIVVHIMSGNYFVDATETISEEYSGSNGYRVIFKGEGESKPVFSGGKEITGFTHWQNGIYKASFDSENELRELFVDGIPAVRAKSKWLYKYIEDYDDGNSLTTKIVVSDKEFPALAHSEEAEFVWETTWVCQRTPVNNIEVIDGKTVVTLDNFYQTDGVDSILVKAGKCFYIENALEFLDEPGEFYYSKADKTVYYYPYDGENPSEMEFIAPVTEGLLSIEGKSFTKKVSNLTFENISFKHGTWNQPNSYPLLAVQAGAATNAETQKTDVLPPAQITVDYADSIEFKGCTFESMGANALAFNEAVTNVSITGNVLKDIGGAAISIGKSTQTEIKVLDYREVCKNFRISNNVIRRTAFHYREMPAIVAYYANGVQITDNDMKDTAYSGISAGWGWDSAKNINKNSGRFMIKGNKIKNVLWSVTDGGNIYTLGHLPDSVIKENYLDSNLAPSFLQYPGIYLDEGSTYINVLDNVVTNCNQRWLFVNNSDEDIFAEIKGNYTDGTTHLNVSTTALGENYTGLTTFPEKAQSIMAAAGVKLEYEKLLSGVEIAEEKVENIYSAPENEYYEGLLVPGTSFYSGSVTACGETYVSFNLGNYMYYKVDVPKTATYDISAYIGVGGDDESKTVPLSWKIDELGTTNNVTVPYTGGYGKYEPFTMGCVTLEKGTYTLYIKNNGSGCHVNKFIFTEREEVIITATDLYNGSVTDVGTNYVSFNAGNYMYYNVEVPIDGTYDMTAYVGVGGDDTSKVIQFAWQYDASGSVHFANVKYTGGYGKYEPFSLGSVYLTAGKHSLWLKNNSGGCHVQKLVIK